MIASLNWHDHVIKVDFSQGVSLAIPLEPNGPQPSFFTQTPATARPLRSGDYVGDVSQGGSCNADTIELVPHCHGTHTECVGHIRATREAVQETIYDQPGLALVVGTDSVASGSKYPEISRSTLEDAIPSVPLIDALILRNLPANPRPESTDYANAPAYPVLANDAMDWLSRQELRHLLVESPSLDPAHDGGSMANHRRWWDSENVEFKSGLNPARRSVTEMIRVPDTVKNGYYWLHLELSPIKGDATPSRPIIYPVEFDS